MANYLFIALGSALGGVLRFWLTELLQHGSGGKFPLGTVVVNVTGSFLIGLIFTLTGEHANPSANAGLWRNFLMVGICGGYTTFSAFSLQTLQLARGGEWTYAGLNIFLSIALCLIGVWLGQIAAQAIQR
jgi:CrcB protein